MGLFNGDQHVKMEDSTKTWHRGKVVDNQDPTKKARVKCLIPGMFEGDASVLPWCYPMSPNSTGGATSGGFSVPKVGDELIISFPYGDKNMPVYMGQFQSSTNHPVAFDESDSYGNSSGTQFGNNSWFKVDEKNGTFEYKHPSGSFITIDSKGSIYICAEGDLGLYSKGGNIYLGANQGLLVETESGPLGLCSAQDICIFGSGNIGMSCPQMIIRDCKGIIADEGQSGVLHNCKIKDFVSKVTGAIVKKIGATIKSAMSGAGKKFSVVSQTSEAKGEAIKAMTSPNSDNNAT